MISRCRLRLTSSTRWKGNKRSKKSSQGKCSQRSTKTERIDLLDLTMTIATRKLIKLRVSKKGRRLLLLALNQRSKETSTLRKKTPRRDLSLSQ